jgi:predicted phage tail protein
MRWLAGLKNLAHDTTFKRRQIAKVDGEDPVGADGTEGPLSKKIAQFIRDGIENQQQLNQTPLEEPDTESGDEQE